MPCDIPEVLKLYESDTEPACAAAPDDEALKENFDPFEEFYKKARAGEALKNLPEAAAASSSHCAPAASKEQLDEPEMAPHRV